MAKSAHSDGRTQEPGDPEEPREPRGTLVDPEEPRDPRKNLLITELTLHYKV